jgi:hypothetical protein
MQKLSLFRQTKAVSVMVVQSLLDDCLQRLFSIYTHMFDDESRQSDESNS